MRSRSTLSKLVMAAADLPARSKQLHVANAAGRIDVLQRTLKIVIREICRKRDSSVDWPGISRKPQMLAPWEMQG